MERKTEGTKRVSEEEKERFLDRVGGYELDEGELSAEEIEDLLKKEASDERD